MKIPWRILVSIFLILTGVFLLLNNFGVIPWSISSSMWLGILLFGGGGLVFLLIFLSNRENWWAIIPAFSLLGLVPVVANIFPGDFGAAFFLAMIGTGFCLIYLTHRENWWAIIPGGILVTLAVVILISSYDPSSFASATALFIGLALTFLLVYLLPTVGGRNTWAIWPAGALGVLGLLLSIGMEGAAGLIFPAAMILVGIWLVFRARQRK